MRLSAWVMEPIAPLHVGPAAAMAGGHAHRVVELDVAGSGIARTAEGADQAGRGDHGLHLLALEEILGDIGGRAKIELLKDRASSGVLNSAANSAQEGGRAGCTGP